MITLPGAELAAIPSPVRAERYAWHSEKVWELVPQVAMYRLGRPRHPVRLVKVMPPD